MTRKEYNNCVDKTADKLYRFCLKLCKHEQDAQDLVQVSYEKLWKNRRSVEMHFAQAWLFRTARNAMIDSYRKKQTEARILDLKFPNIPEENMDTDLRDLLQKAFKTLSKEQKQLILLRDYEGYSYKEIAVIMDLSMSQVKVYIFRARKALKTWILNSEKKMYNVHH